MFAIGCGHDDDCVDYDVPGGYYQCDEYSESDYKTVTYTNGSDYITFISSDNGCHWDTHWGYNK